MAITTGSVSKLLAVGLRKVLFNEYEAQPKEYTKFCNIKTSTRNYEEDLEFIGLGGMPEKPEGTNTIYADPSQGAVVRYTWTSFGYGFRVTREGKDDDLYNIVKPTRMAKELGWAAAIVREQRAANILNNGFSATSGYTKNGTAEKLFQTHTLAGSGGTFSNVGAADLSDTALQAAIINFHQLVNEQGFPVVYIPKTLWVPPDSIMLARTILGSQFGPYTANQQINPLQADKLGMEVLHFLTDTDSWFVSSDKHDVNFFTRTDLEYEYGDDFDTGDTKVKCFQRFGVGRGDWRGWYGSPGA